MVEYLGVFRHVGFFRSWSGFLKGDETMDRKSCTLALMAVLALGLCKLQMVVAQVPPQGNQYYGTFGNRTLGQPLVPGPRTFGGGIQIAPGGSSIGHSIGSPASATPGLQNNTSVPMPNAAAQPALNALPSPQSSMPEYNLPEIEDILNLARLSSLETNGRESTSRAEPTLGPTRGIGPPAARRSYPTRARRSCPTA